MSTEDTSANVIHGTARPHVRLGSLVFDPRACALGLLGVYLAFTAALLAMHVSGRGLALLHVAILAVVLWSGTRRGERARLIGDFLPLVAAPALYAEIPVLIAIAQTTYHDATIQAIELATFGAQPARVFATTVHVPALSELLHAGYLAYYPAIFAPPLLLYVRGARRGYHETVAVLTATYLVCWAIFVAAPVEGPRYAWGAAAAPDGPMRTLANAVLAAGSSRGAAFPSSHMAVMTAQAIMALVWQRAVGVVVTVIAILVGFGAVYGGFHYATDMIAGALTGALIAALFSLLFSKSRAQRAQ